MSVNVTTLTDNELKNKINWGINEIVCVGNQEKNEWHNGINLMCRKQLLREYEKLAKNGWFDEK